MAEMCATCGLLKGDEQHLTAGDCIRALRVSMMKQRELAESMAFDISMRFLGALEELAAHPDIGIPFRVWKPALNGEEPKIFILQALQVAGVFQAILQKYREAADWTPLADTKKALGISQLYLKELLRVSELTLECLDDGGCGLLRDDLQKLIAEIKARGLNSPGPVHS